MTPVYYRFCFSPSDGQVRLSHNNEGHPAHIRMHSDLAAEANEHGCVHGYAFRVHDGYRVFDFKHNPLVDPFIRERVRKAIDNDHASQ
jgi:hypothetical protein